VRSKTDSEPA